MLVQNNEVRHVVGAARIRELLHDIVSAIDAVRVGEHEPHLLCKLQ